MKGYQIVIIVIVFFVIGYFLSEKAFGATKLSNGTKSLTNPDELVGKVDLWCENGKYYKRTSTAIYGQPTMLELTKPEFDALVAQGISYSGCSVDANGNIIS